MARDVVHPDHPTHAPDAEHPCAPPICRTDAGAQPAPVQVMCLDVAPDTVPTPKQWAARVLLICRTRGIGTVVTPHFRDLELVACLLASQEFDERAATATPVVPTTPLDV